MVAGGFIPRRWKCATPSGLYLFRQNANYIVRYIIGSCRSAVGAHRLPGYPSTCFRNGESLMRYCAQMQEDASADLTASGRDALVNAIGNTPLVRLTSLNKNPRVR